jgi:3'-phosphoadenosine 5'-phosphosulfate sulfotransferase (PAPS reductase)/FAD synthetase
MKSELLKKGIVMTGDITGPVSVVVPLSGGKDSQACLMLALKEHKPENVLALFCDTGFEHPITYKHVERITEKYGVNLVMLQAGTVLEKCLKYKRFPGGGARHCTDELKIRPAKFFYKEMAILQGGFQVWYGVRSDESKEREKRYRYKVSTDLYTPNEFMDKYPKYLADMGVMFRLPVLDWSRSEIFEYLNGEENPLYSSGFDRVGCFPCLAGGEAHQMRAFHFDETGRKHYRIAEQISEIAGRPVLQSKKYRGQGPGSALFDDSFSGCAICAI